MPESTDPLGALTAALNALCAIDPERLSDREAIKTAYRQLARLEAVVTRASAAFDAGRELWRAAGGSSEHIRHAGGQGSRPYEER